MCVSQLKLHRVCRGKIGTDIFQILGSLEPCFYVRSIARMALRRLTEETFLSDEFDRELVIPGEKKSVHV